MADEVEWFDRIPALCACAGFGYRRMSDGLGWGGYYLEVCPNGCKASVEWVKNGKKERF